ncbi:non-canonical purine NTP pyrophosphatase [Anaerobacillus arseniciselenatis]|uniref:dITP/XTP pyrophosphatase n=1 Tax=Anaerobacillus arseniciselenatis TaxID=85682 RepID=A0A1S2LCU9_9BACI|nr:XTP/dITP diphosphatase [Anaerobacillus arseniciselenatis]OIJ10322.1 non-canonical purine NTP pyrophosphatase [Anaerobacillus arseniciselenatis]
MEEILIATKNKGKAKDFEQLFAPFNIGVKTLLDMENAIDVEEDGTTFQENAIKKAETIAREFNIPTLADDSGLIVDALDGRPGVYSARYAGMNKDDQANLNKVLDELKNVPESKRSARFHCSLALALPGKKTVVVDGTCDGVITQEPIGDNGFGYDPIMFIPALDKTMAQLSKQEKNEISHRANALKHLKEILTMRQVF